MPVALSIILPAYNEATRLPPYLATIRTFADTHHPDNYEIIVVDDGGDDHLSDVLAQLNPAWPQLSCLRHPQNRGKGAAVRSGVSAATGARILFADADGATPIGEAAKLLAALDDGAEVAIGSRLLPDPSVRRRRTCGRSFVGRTFAAVARRMLALSVHDTQCGFKMFRQEAARRLFALSSEDGYLFDVEILALARRLGYRLAEVPITWEDRPGSRLDPWRDPARMLAGLWRVRRRLNTLSFEYDGSALD
jgi:dolichyl-phosphate beta-glucosyltransferase